MVPVVSFASNLSMPLFLVGLFLGFAQLAMVGAVLYAFAVAFQLITLPVEFDASRRALDALESGGFLTREELPGARKVLTAAACTYVAAALVSIAQLIRLTSLADRAARPRACGPNQGRGAVPWTQNSAGKRSPPCFGGRRGPSRAPTWPNGCT